MHEVKPIVSVLPGALPEWRYLGGLEESELIDDTAAVLDAPAPHKEQILEWLLNYSDQDTLWVLAGLKNKLPHLIDAVGKSSDQARTKSIGLIHAGDRSGSPRMTTPDNKLSQQLLKKQSSNLASNACPIVQFSTQMYFCVEDEGQMHIDILRIGNLHKRSEVWWTTQDATAKAGQNYKSNSSRLVFEPYCAKMTVDVDLMNNAIWDTTLEFVVILTKEDAINATLGRYLWQARVKIMDDDCFPSNKYKDQIMENDFESVSGFSLLFEFFKLMFRGSTKWNTFKIMAVDQLNNLNLIGTLIISVYLVDVVLNFDESTSKVVFQDRKAALVLLVVLTLVPFAILHGLDRLKNTWGADAAVLKRNLLRKFLHFSEASRGRLRDGDLVMVITRDADALVNSGYSTFVALVAALGRLLLLLIYEIVSPFIWDVPNAFASLIPLCAFPLLMGAFIMLRRKKTSQALTAKQGSQTEEVEYVQQASGVYRLIADYNRRPRYVEKFEEVVDRFYNDDTVSSLVLGNNAYFAPWITVLSVSMFTVIGGMQVLDDNLTLGNYLTTLRIFQTVGDSWGTIYAVLLTMQVAVPTLKRIITFMNMPTDMGQRMMLNRKRRKDTMELGGYEGTLNVEMVPLDSLPIIVSNIQFRYEGSAQALGQMNQTGMMKISQGEFISIVGPRGQGKSTLLKILGGVILPDISGKDGNLFVPSHLRVLHVSAEPLFFIGTLLENLAFGLAPGDEDASKQRVIAICQRLGLPDHIQKLVDSEDTTWIQMLSQTQRYLLTICRALVANYEVCCMHKPAVIFDDLTSTMILEILREFVMRKGIELDANASHLRRPRTCVVTVSNALGVKLADRVLCVDVTDGVREISPQDITPDQLS